MMRAANTNTDPAPRAPRTCFLCDAPETPFLWADCRGEDVTICTPLCLKQHGFTLPLTEAALNHYLVGELP